jgi:hypothetical protein
MGLYDNRKKIKNQKANVPDFVKLIPYKDKVLKNYNKKYGIVNNLTGNRIHHQNFKDLGTTMRKIRDR